MQNFQIKEELAGNVANLHLSGYVNEFATFPPLPQAQTINIYLGQVTGLNSIGTRNWVRWMKTKAPLSFVHIHEAPPIFVKGFNTVAGMNALNLKVESFMVPYLSEDGDERKNVIFERAVHFTNAFKIMPPRVLDSQGKEMEMDVLNDYFGFLGQ